MISGLMLPTIFVGRGDGGGGLVGAAVAGLNSHTCNRKFDFQMDGLSF